MTPQHGEQTVTILILLNASLSKNNLAMKYGQIIEYNKNFFFKNHAENETERLDEDLVLFFFFFNFI